MSQFIESIKVEDQQIFLLDLHQKRIEDTFSHYEKDCKINIKEIFNSLDHTGDGLYKFRIEYDLENSVRTQMIPYAISELDDFELIINNDINYNFKSSDRDHLQKIKNQSQAQEVIIIQNNEVTDTSFSNLIFLKDKTWYTPKTYLLNGVMRQSLLNSENIKEYEITQDNIKEFSHFKVINALNDFENSYTYPIERITNLPKRELDFDLL